MTWHSQRRVGLVTVLAALLAGCSSGTAASPSSSAAAPPSSSVAAPTTAASSGPSASAVASTAAITYEATLEDGSKFSLSQAIRDKVAKKEPINYVFSYGSSAVPLFSAQYLAGYEASLPVANAIYPIKGVALAPADPAGNAQEQIAQVQARLDTNQLDCLSIGSGSDLFTKLINDTLKAGIPVFEVGGPRQPGSNELTAFTQVPLKEGAQAAQVVIDWMKANNKDLKVFAVSSGANVAPYAQGRMKSFVETIKAAIPDAKFLNTEVDAIDTTYDPATSYDKYKAFITAHPDVQFIENVDIGAEHANRAIKDLKKTGQIYTIGWNVSLAQLDGIDEGTQVAVLDQRWVDQAGFGAKACSTFMATGEVLPNTQELLVIQKADTAAAREELKRILGQ